MWITKIKKQGARISPMQKSSIKNMQTDFMGFYHSFLSFQAENWIQHQQKHIHHHLETFSVLATRSINSCSSTNNCFASDMISIFWVYLYVTTFICNCFVLFVHFHPVDLLTRQIGSDSIEHSHQKLGIKNNKMKNKQKIQSNLKWNAI